MCTEAEWLSEANAMRKQLNLDSSAGVQPVFSVCHLALLFPQRVNCSEQSGCSVLPEEMLTDYITVCFKNHNTAMLGVKGGFVYHTHAC